MKTGILLSAATLVLLAGACSKSRQAGQEIPQVDVAEAATDSLTIYRTYPGTLQSANTVDVVARVNGQLLSSDFKSGDLVKKGQRLFTIESTSYRDAVQQARAALASAKSSYEYNTRQYAAMKKALESDAVSQMEVASAKNAAESSAAAIKEAEAQLSTALTNLGYCTVTAPITGYISTREVDPGSYVGGAAAPVKLATIYDNANLYAVFFMEDDSFLKMRPAATGVDYTRIPVSFSDTLAHSYTADMSYLSPSVNTSTGTLEVRADISNPYNELRNGMYVSVRLPWRTEPKAVLVRDESIGTDQLGKFLYTVNDSNKVVYTPVKIGDLYNDTLRIVSEGIAPGRRYVTKALLKVRPGMEIKPVE